MADPNDQFSSPDSPDISTMPLPPPTPAEQAYQTTLANQPKRPQPKLWQRILAGGMGAIQGYSQIARYGPHQMPTIDMQPAIQNLYGMPQYQAATSAWQQQVGAQKEAVENERKERENLETSRLRQSQQDLNDSYRRMNNDSRMAGVNERQQANDQTIAQRFEAGGGQIQPDIQGTGTTSLPAYQPPTGASAPQVPLGPPPALPGQPQVGDLTPSGDTLAGTGAAVPPPNPMAQPMPSNLAMPTDLTTKTMTPTPAGMTQVPTPPWAIRQGAETYGKNQPVVAFQTKPGALAAQKAAGTASATAQTVTLEMADKLGAEFGVKAGDQVPPALFENLQRLVAGKEKPLPTHPISVADIRIRAAGGQSNNPDANNLDQGVAQKVVDGLKSTNVAAMDMISPEALAEAAQRYEKTGVLPNLGLGAGAGAVKTKIMNAGATQSGGKGDIAANSANFGADKGSLASLQKLSDSVTAFESTASANLDLFLQQAKKIVDTGSPWINTPLRAVNRAALGNEDLVAYDAARRVALNEVSKVTSSANLMGALSDSARHEVEGLSPDNATLGQIYRVVSILRQDMSNRKMGFDNQIREIKGRLNPTPPPSAPDNGPKNYVRFASGAAGHRIGQTPDGKWWDTISNQEIPATVPQGK